MTPFPYIARTLRSSGPPMQVYAKIYCIAAEAAQLKRQASMFTPEEHRTIVQCLRAAADGPFFPEWEFSTLFGFSRNEFRNQASLYEQADDLPVHVGIAVHNTLNNLIGYPIDDEDQWSEWIPVPRAALQILFDKWRAHYDYS